eukprot:386894-Pleurochrysis_carterae.AAC.3
MARRLRRAARSGALIVSRAGHLPPVRSGGLGTLNLAICERVQTADTDDEIDDKRDGDEE